ncbi:hypothetical protein GCM10009105_22570 [Dokdonella soli]|uniref:Secreted protein n=2 Tax=Dokdonella soli TaxID=529810 RepID=A0ABN1IKK3_9GAMM
MLLSSLLFGAAQAHADLMFHQGFETCWTPSSSTTQFLDSMRTRIEGLHGCVPQQSGTTSGVTYSVCGTPACDGGAIGCPIVLHAQAFSGDFPTGVFSAPGTADSITLPVSYASSTFGNGACNKILSAIALTYKPDYTMLVDGPGVYSDALAQVAVTINSYTLGGTTCGLLDGFVVQAITNAIPQAQNAAAQAVSTALAPTVGVTTCPLTP